MAADEYARLSERLTANRDRLAILLDQQARLGIAQTPASVRNDMRDARRDIQLLKARLRKAGATVADEPEDDDPDAPPSFDNLSCGVELFDQSPSYRTFYRTPRLGQLVDTIFATSYYHIIEAPMGHGKTALAGEIWRAAQRANYTRLVYLFSRDYGRTRVGQAVRSLYRQLQSSHSDADGAAVEESGALTTSAIERVARAGSRLLILLDGLDECEDAERPLLAQLLPDGVVPNVTIVITLRPKVHQLLLQHLPLNHMLQQLRISAEGRDVLYHRLSPLNLEDITSMLEAVGTPAERALVERIHQHSQGLPMFAVPYIEQPRLLDEVRSGTPPADAYYERALKHITAQCPEEQRPLLQRLLAILAAARSPLSPVDIEHLLGVSRAEVATIHERLARYQHLDPGEIALSQYFRDYLSRSDVTSAAVVAANAELMAWATGFADERHLARVPLYALRHAAEYMATSTELCRLLARADWFAELERRCRARSTCIEAIKRAQAEIDRRFTGSPDDPTIVNMILCALVRASLSATLMPELVAYLVRLGLWSEAEGKDYAENYVSQANRQALITLLAQPQQVLSFPVGTAAAEAAAILEQFARLGPEARQNGLAKWRRDYEQAGGDSDAQADRDLLMRLNDALIQPALSGGQRVSLAEFSRLLTDLTSYQAPLTGPMSDPNFADLLAQLADIWWQLRPRDSHTVWLQPIMATLSHFPRADLLESLELLAPTLRTLFPESIGALCAALDTLGKGLMAE